MKLLTSIYPRNGRLLPAGGWFTLALGVFLVALEIVGRYTTSDLHDALAAFCLLMMVCAVVARHRREPLPWVNRLLAVGNRGIEALSRFRYDHGIDLRGTPPLPRRTPAVVFVILLLLLMWGAAAAGAWAAFPTGWRALGCYLPYTVYLLFMLMLWALLIAITVVGIFVPVAMLDTRLKSWVGETDRRGAELAAIVGYAVLVATVAYFVPPVAVLGLCGLVAVVAGIVYLPRGSDGAALLWRSSPGSPIYAVPLRRVLAVVVGLIALIAFDVLLTACGGRLLHAPRANDTMPLTALLGTVAAWMMPGLLAAFLLKLYSARRNDPARRTPPTLYISGTDRAAVRRAAQIASGWGWHVRLAPAKREAAFVGIEIVAPEHSEAQDFNPRWPLKVSLADLEEGSVKARLDRRDEIHVRRQLFRGLQKLFKRASMFKGPAGGGFWLAPHWWFVEAVAREDADASSEESPPLVGPAYGRVIPPRARQHSHAVLRATQIDMIFVEDGVSYRSLERALRVLTELYDVHGGQRRAEELHFRGLPKVKVMIHDYEPGNPFRSDLYPEPKFDDLSRVRVLHIFRDRGGHEELIEPPFDWSSTPLPVGALG